MLPKALMVFRNTVERVAQARLQALAEALVRGHTAEQHHQQEARDDHAGHRHQIHLAGR